jgi:hypothetical protein
VRGELLQARGYKGLQRASLPTKDINKPWLVMAVPMHLTMRYSVHDGIEIKASTGKRSLFREILLRRERNITD